MSAGADRDPAIAAASERFWKKVAISGTDECWIWNGSTAHGYGSFSFRAMTRSPYKAHRFSYEERYGPIPQGMHVCHKCDNPPCVNPDHLFLGNDRDNIHDARRKGRLRTGKCHQNYGRSADDIFAGRHFTRGAAVLTEEIVRDIRRRKEAGEPATSIASEIGVSRSCVYSVCSGRTWGHVA